MEDINEQVEVRLGKLKKLKEAGFNLYPIRVWTVRTPAALRMARGFIPAAPFRGALLREPLTPRPQQGAWIDDEAGDESADDEMEGPR